MSTWDETAAEKRGTAEIMNGVQGAGARAASPHHHQPRGCRGGARARGSTRSRASSEFPYLAHAPMEPLTAALPARPAAVRDLGGLPVPDHRPDECRRAGRPEARAGHHPHAGGGRHLRPARQRRDPTTLPRSPSIAKATGGKYPVRLIWTREDDITGGKYRPLNLPSHQRRHRQDGIHRLPPARGGAVDLAGTALAAMMKDGIDPRCRRGQCPGAARTREHAPQLDAGQRRRAGLVVALGGTHPHRRFPRK